MWTREELKTRGKAAFLRNYWICVVAALILTLLVGSGTSNSGNSNNDSNQTNSVGISGFTISSDNFNVESFAEKFTPLGPVKFVFYFIRAPPRRYVRRILLSFPFLRRCFSEILRPATRRPFA